MKKNGTQQKNKNKIISITDGVSVVKVTRRVSLVEQKLYTDRSTRVHLRFLVTGDN
jgi:hypothetical protein